MIQLPTKTFGKKAKREILKHLPTASTFKKVLGSFVIRDKAGIMLAHVDEGNLKQAFATLVIASK